jgi:hypothetical protein
VLAVLEAFAVIAIVIGAGMMVGRVGQLAAIPVIVAIAYLLGL